MPQNINDESTNIGEIVYHWTVKEYEQYERNRNWYIMMGVVGGGMVLFGFLTGNYLFSLIIILFSIILYINHNQEPLEVPFAITSTGVVIGDKYYRYSELNNFWIIYNPPEIKNLYFSFHRTVQHRMQIPLLNYDPQPIRDILKQYLAEDLEQEDEPLSDRLSRLLRLH